MVGGGRLLLCGMKCVGPSLTDRLTDLSVVSSAGRHWRSRGRLQSRSQQLLWRKRPAGAERMTQPGVVETKMQPKEAVPR
jgi:hypothetical protein